MKNRHLILTNGRSGSNFLANSLNKHPNIVNYGEVLANKLKPYIFYDKSKQYKIYSGSIIDYLHYIYTSKTFFYGAQLYSAYSHFRKKKPINFKTWGKVTHIGTKDFFLNYRKKNAWDFIFSNQDVAIIYLYRENLLRRCLSNVFLAKTGVAASEKPGEVQKVNINLSELMKKLEILDDEVAHEKRMLGELKDHRLIAIKYEDYFVDETSILTHNQQIFEFLGVEVLQLKSQHKKLLPQQMCDLIGNYDEFYTHISNTPYQKYLD